jgi:hypothetical protein
LVVSAGLLSILAGVVAYLGIAIVFAVASSNGNAKAIAASAAYVSGAFGTPIVAGVYLARSRGWGRLRAIRFAAAVSLLVHAALLPVALAALAM